MSNRTKKAFDIGRIPKNLDLSTPPATGFDYLYRVRLETRRCPKVVVSDLDTTQFLSKQTVLVDTFNGFVRARPGFEPDLTWQDDQLDTFISTRAEIFDNKEELIQKFPKKEFPKIGDEKSWCLFCLGSHLHQKVFPHYKSESAPVEKACTKELASNSSQSSGSKESCDMSASKESLDSIEGFTVVKQAEGLSGSSSNSEKLPGLEQLADDAEPRSKRSRSIPEEPSPGNLPLLSIVLHLNQTRITRLLAFHLRWLTSAGISDDQARWLYALLMCLEKPLDPDDCALLRSLARKCSELRGELDDPQDQLLVSINLVLSIISRFFDQKDMSDRYLTD